MLLNKRELTPAERQQRVEAARSRWEGHVAAAATGAATTGAAALGVKTARRALAGASIAEGRVAATNAKWRADTSIRRHADVVASMHRSRPGWPLAAWRRHLNRQMRLDENAGTLTPAKAESYRLRMHAAEMMQPARRSGWYVAGSSRTLRDDRTTVIPERLQRPMEERLREGWKEPRNRAARQPLIFPTGDDLKEMRSDIRSTLRPRHEAFKARTQAKATAAADAAKKEGIAGAKAVLRSIPRISRGRLAAIGAGGALAGLAGSWALGKGMPSQPRDALGRWAAGHVLPVVARWTRGTKFNAEKISEHLTGGAKTFYGSHETAGAIAAVGVRGGPNRAGKLGLFFIDRAGAMKPQHVEALGVRQHELGHIADEVIRPALSGRRGTMQNVRSWLPEHVAEHPAHYPTAALQDAERVAELFVGAGAKHHRIRRAAERFASERPEHRKAIRAVRLAGLKAGVLTKRRAGTPVARLAKAAPDDGSLREDVPEDSDFITAPDPGETEADVAARLGRMFRSWLDNPGKAGNEKDVGEAMRPLRRVMRDGADAAGGPPRTINAMREGPGGDRSLVFSFDYRNPEVQRRLEGYELDRIRAISQESRDAIRGALISAAQSGTPIPEQARQIRETIGLSPGQKGWVTSYRRQLETLDPRVLDRALRDRRFDSPIRRAIEKGEPLSAEQIDRYVDAYHRRTLAYRATTIARTEALRAANAGMIETARAQLAAEPGARVQKIWIATKDDRTRDAHRALDGQVVEGMDTPFIYRDPSGHEVAIRWPHDTQAPADQVVNCLLPGTKVFAPGLLAATMRKYDGDAIRIQAADGSDLTCTVNHPVLTARGWVAAQFLQEGDRVVCGSSADWNVIVDDHKHAPARVEELHDALNLVGLPSLEVAAGMHFHHERVDGKVSVVFAERKLVSDQHASFTQPIRDAVLLGRRLVQNASPGLRLALMPLNALLDAAGSDMSGAHLRFANVLRHLAPLEPLGLTACPRSATVLAEDAADNVAGNAVLLRQALDRLATIEDGEKGCQVRRRPNTALLPRLAARMVPVSRLERFRYVGHVYNLETDSRMFIAGGIVNHNCRCTFGLRVLAPERGRMIPLTAEAV